eukprot:6177420-Pleurochrysis_carterae.AAC.3
MAEDRELWSGPAADVPKVLSTQYGNCGTPWLSVRNGRRPANFTFLVDTLDHSPGGHGGADIVLPFLVSKPRWLVGSGKPPFALVPWAQRKLLFFAGTEGPSSWSQAIPVCARLQILSWTADHAPYLSSNPTSCFLLPPSFIKPHIYHIFIKSPPPPEETDVTPSTPFGSAALLLSFDISSLPSLPSVDIARLCSL